MGDRLLVLSNAYGTATSAVASLTVNTPPQIVLDPVSITVCPGDPASFEVAAAGTAPLAYQWRQEGAAIPDGTAATLVIAAATLADTGSYDCVVSNACGDATSGTATLTLNSAPEIVTQPESVTVCAGGEVTFEVRATGTALLADELGFRNNRRNIPGVWIPERWTLALVRFYLCHSHTFLHSYVEDAFMHNVTSINGESTTIRARVEPFKHALAGLMLVRYVILDYFVDEFGLEGDYVVFWAPGSKGAEELFSGAGDLDGDGLTNFEEYERTVAVGGSMEDFVEAATGGEPGVPNVTWPGIVLLAGLVLLAAVFLVRRRSRKARV